MSLVVAFGAAMTPVLFAYGGWQTASFVAGEMKHSARDLPRALLIGVAGVIALYLSVTFVCVHVLGAAGLARTTTPASAVMRAALGEPGARFIAIGIAVSTFGFMSQGMLTAPRVYFAMAEDGLFFRSVAWISPRTAAPVVADRAARRGRDDHRAVGTIRTDSELRDFGRFHFVRNDRDLLD